VKQPPLFAVDGVLNALHAQRARVSGGGRAVLFVSARGGEGVSTVARAVAEAAGPSAVYAIDLDLKRNGLAKALSQSAPLGPKIDGRLGGVSFYTVRGAGNAPLREMTPAFSYHRVGRSLIFAGVFNARVLPRNARVAVSARPDYWNAARAGGATVVIDAPALDRSQVALRVAAHMDGVVLVVGADAGSAPAAIAAKTALVNAGANLIGLVYAGAPAPVMAMERLLREAG
jgi:Mrp family chromosome partitioning ATPase